MHTGLLLKADNEAEVVGVLAHELAHGAARHGTPQASHREARSRNWLHTAHRHGRLGRLRSPPGCRSGGAADFLKYYRNFEREADLLGLQYLYQAGCDPAAMVDFFEKLEAMEKEKPGTMADGGHSQGHQAQPRR